MTIRTRDAETQCGSNSVSHPASNESARAAHPATASASPRPASYSRKIAQAHALGRDVEALGALGAPLLDHARHVLARVRVPGRRAARHEVADAFVAAIQIYARPLDNRQPSAA